MIFYENEIKRMNMWEKVVQVSSEVGFVAPSVEQAKIEIAKGMAKFGLVLFQSSEGLQKLVDVHNTNEYVEIASETREKALLELFNVTIMKETVKAVEPKQEVKAFTPNTKFDVVNTPQEAVAKVNEVANKAKVDEVYVNEMHDYISSKVGIALKLAKTDDIVNSNRPKAIFAKLKSLDWNKKDFREAMNAILGLGNFETQMSNDQCTQIIKFLEQEEIEHENNQRKLEELDKGFTDEYIANEII